MTTLSKTWKIPHMSRGDRLNFGKHKGRSIAEVIASEGYDNAMAYFFWLSASEVVSFDDEMSAEIAEWAKNRPKKVNQILRNIAAAKAEPGTIPPPKSNPVRAEVPAVTFTSETNSNWGIW